MTIEINNPLSIIDHPFQRGVRRDGQRVRAGAVYTFMQNKPNSPCFRAQNGVSDEKRTQSNPIHRPRASSGVERAAEVSSFAPNKPNFGFWGPKTRIEQENKANQSQSGPVRDTTDESTACSLALRSHSGITSGDASVWIKGANQSHA